MQTLHELIEALAGGAAREREPLATALARARGDDAELRAWAYVAPGEPADHHDRSDARPLRGIPFGVKDNIDVAGMPTRAASEVLLAAPAQHDAWCVAAMRAAGAVPIGKLHTTAYAFKDPAPTFNPWSRTQTPGGSSAGSAAAVAAGHVPFAFGTQTQGSVLRPASYCGIVGFKPTYAKIPTQGVLQFAPSLDTVGILCRTAADATLLARILDPQVDPEAQTSAPTILCDVEYGSAIIGAAARDALRAYAERLRAAGATIEFAPLPGEVERAREAIRTIMAFEGHAVHGAVRHDERLTPALREIFAEGAGIGYGEYRAALGERERLRDVASAFVANYDAVLVPTAGPAPDRRTTGHPELQAPWTGFGFPAISLPYALAADGLPLGAQFVTVRERDGALLAVARWAERAVVFSDAPPAADLPGPRSGPSAASG